MAKDVRFLNALIENDFSVTNAALDLGTHGSTVSRMLREIEAVMPEGYFIKGPKIRNGAAFKGIAKQCDIDFVTISYEFDEEFRETFYGKQS